MQDDQKTKAELLKEIDSLRRRVADLEQIKHNKTGKKSEDSEQAFKTIFDNTADGIVLADVENKKFYLANQVFCQLLGYNLQEIKDLEVSNIHPEKDLPHVLAQFELQAKQELKIAKNIPVRRKNGSVFYADINSFLINLAGKKYIMGIFQDITERRKAEISLKEAEDKLKNYINSIAMGISVISPNMEILDMNHTFRKWYPQIDISNKPKCYKSFYDPPKEEICTYCPTIKAFKDSKSHYSETDLSADGNYYLVSAAPLKDNRGKVISVIETVQNITELKKMEESAKKSQAQAWSLIQTAPNIILYLSPDHRILEFNPEAERFFGRKREDVLGQNYLELFVPEQHRYAVAADIEKVLAGEPTRNHENSLIAHDGSEHLFMWNVNRILDEEDKPLGIIAIGQDITERKRWEETLQESEEKFRLAMETTNDALWDWNMVTNEVYRNPRHATMLGYEPHELTASQDEWENRIHPDDKGLVFNILDEYLTGTKNSFNVEYRLKTKSGDYIWVLGRGKVVAYSDNGSPARMIGTNIDITSRKKAAIEVEKFQKMSDHSPHGCAMSDLYGNITYINDSFARMHGYTPNELIGKNLEIFHNDAQITHVRELNNELVETGQGLHNEEVWHMHRDGTEFPTLMSSWIIEDNNGNPTVMCATAINITEHKRIREQLENLAKFPSENPSPVLRISKDCTILYANDASSPILETWERKLGERVPDAYCKQIEEVISSVGISKFDLKCHNEQVFSVTLASVKDADYVNIYGLDITEVKEAEDEIIKLSSAVEQSKDGIAIGDFEQKLLYVNKAFARIHGYTAEDMIGMPLAKLHNKKQISEYQKVVDLLKTQDSWEGEIQHIKKDGTAFPTYISISLLKNSNGKTIGKLAILRDISETKRREEQLNMFRKKMARTEQLASLGTLSATAAHELAQPLTIASLSIENALDNLEAASSTDFIARKLKDSLTELSNIKLVIDRLKNYARLHSEEECILGQIDLKEVAEKIVNLLNNSANQAGITLHLKGINKLPPVYSNKKDLEQLFFALIENAIIAVNHKTNRQLIISGAVKDEHVELQFSDNCEGITPENIDKIFEPFFTTKPEGKGTGLGLSIVQRALSKVSGKVWVKSEVGKGSTFFVTLPISDKYDTGT